MTTTSIKRAYSMDKRLQDMAKLLDVEHVLSIPLHVAKASMCPFRATVGFKAVPTKLLTASTDNAKFTKNVEHQVGLSLQPANGSLLYNTCTASTRGCRAVCNANTGNGLYPTAQRGRTWKTLWLAQHPDHFMRVLIDELDRLPDTTMVRLNTFSDVLWERHVPWLFPMFSWLRFFDYTKQRKRFGPWAARNYKLAYSASERDTDTYLLDRIDEGWNVAVVTRDWMRDVWLDVPAVSASKSDAWILHNNGVFGLLHPISVAQSNTTKFVRVESINQLV